MPQLITVSAERITIDLLLFRKFGRTSTKLIAATLALNPGLSEKGIFLPLGYEVLLPDPVEVMPKQKTQISLFS